MADRSLRARLGRLFSTNVVVRRIAKNRLKVVDTNKLQSSGALSSNSYIDRFSGLHRDRVVMLHIIKITTFISQS